MNNKLLEMNRRKFLKLGASSAAAAGLLNLPLSNIANAMDFPDYKAIVNIFFAGGNDGFNMIVPTTTSEYGDYAASRRNLAIPRGDLIDVTPATSALGPYGFHPALPEVANLFNSSQLSVIANVGNLLEVTTKATFENDTASLPRQLYSHNDQQDQWRYGDPDERVTGWGGRTVDNFISNNTIKLLSGVAIDGKSNYLASLNNQDLTLDRDGIEFYNYIASDGSNRDQERRQVFRALLDMQQNDIFAKEFARSQSSTIDLFESVGNLINGQADFNTPRPEGENKLADALQTVAKIISVREPLGMQRQVFYVSLGGFDTHDDQNVRQPALYTQISQAMNYFNQVLGELNLQEQVTSFTSSEFGRTLTSNGDGTDHAWGNHQLVMGGALNGGDIFGTFPSLKLGGPDDVRNDGRIIPTSSIEQYANPILQWFGMTETQIATILPNLSSFNPNALGFMDI